MLKANSPAILLTVKESQQRYIKSCFLVGWPR